jgi:hypothetical protein
MQPPAIGTELTREHRSRLHWAGRALEALRKRTPRNRSTIHAVLRALNLSRSMQQHLQARILGTGVFEYTSERFPAAFQPFRHGGIPKDARATWFASNTSTRHGTRCALWCGVLGDSAVWVEYEIPDATSPSRNSRLRILIAAGRGVLFECIGAQVRDLGVELAAHLARPLMQQMQSLGGHAMAGRLAGAASEDSLVPASVILGAVSQRLRRAWLETWTREVAQLAPRLALIEAEVRFEVCAEAYCPVVGAATLMSVDGRSIALYQLESDGFFEGSDSATAELARLREITGCALPDRESLAEFLDELCALALAQYRYDCRSTIEVRPIWQVPVEAAASRLDHTVHREARPWPGAAKSECALPPESNVAGSP